MLQLLFWLSAVGGTAAGQIVSCHQDRGEDQVNLFLPGNPHSDQTLSLHPCVHVLGMLMAGVTFIFASHNEAPKTLITALSAIFVT